MAVFVAFVVASVIAFAVATAPPNPVTATDALAAPAAGARSPLDLTDVALVQRDVRMSLRISTAGEWSAMDVADPSRELCVTLVHGTPAAARGRICVTRRGSSSALSYTSLQADGTALARRRLAARVTRPRPNVLKATFLPAAANLAVGPYGWFATSRWTDSAACQTPCNDRLPDSGVVAANVALLGVVPCFGAAARDRAFPCENPSLRLSVRPSLARSQAPSHSSYCDTRERSGLLTICSFGAAPDVAADRFALLGDSHAAGLKAALGVLTLAKRWRGVSMVRPACPATQAAPILPTPARSRQCAAYNQAALAWLADHRNVSTVFLAAHVTAFVRKAPGKTRAETLQAGYRAEIRALLRSVRRVVVVRDPPYSTPGQLRCVGAALKDRVAPGPACALDRRVAVRPDPLALAAKALHSPRVLVIDLTQHYCDEISCFPVIGGALVQRDKTHLTSTFSATLGPYILRALDG